MGAQTLLETYKRWLSESEWLVDCFLDGIDMPGQNVEMNRIMRLPTEMCLMRVYDAWSRFCRELIIVSAACQPYTARGLQLPKAPGISKRREVIPALLSTYRRRTYEPKWGRADESIDAAIRLGLANKGTISGALGAMTSPAQELRIVRNFYAHRSEWAANEIRGLQWYRSSMGFCIEDLAGQTIQGGLTLFQDWVYDLRVIAEAAVQ